MTKTFETSKGKFLLRDNDFPYWSDYPTILIGKVSSLTEEQCKEVVDEVGYSGLDFYKSYVSNFDYCETAKESFSSLLESLGLEQTDLWLFKIIEHEL